MTSRKLANMLGIISENLARENIPFAMIGAMALAAYGLPRYTSDIDLLTEGCHYHALIPIMETLGYTCHQKTDAFAQFDSELGVFGLVDFMFVNTPDGKDILKRRAIINDELFGTCPVIQPSDYIILKLMAIANNPGRTLKDEADMLAVLKLYARNLIPKTFESLNTERICWFADRFGQREPMEKYLNAVFGESCKSDCHKL